MDYNSCECTAYTAGAMGVTRNRVCCKTLLYNGRTDPQQHSGGQPFEMFAVTVKFKMAFCIHVEKALTQSFSCNSARQFKLAI